MKSILNYDNVILHVVWEHDIEVFRKDNTEIPVLELKRYVSANLVQQYHSLKAKKTWINCENSISIVSQFVFKNWQERLFFERLERKSKPVLDFLRANDNDWEATLFCFLAKNFGLNSNGDSFFQLGQSIPFSIIRKEAFDVRYLEALLFGQSGIIPSNEQDLYIKDLIAWYDYLAVKYKIEKKEFLSIQFFKLRPDNFPTIRIAQLAMLYHKQRNLFSKIIEAKCISDCYKIFDVSVSDYWLKHYNFEKPSKFKDKRLSKSFVDLLIINTIIPFKFAYANSLGKDISEEIISWLESLQPETNSVIEKFNSFEISASNAFETQTLLQLKQEYCDKGKCLQCAIGVELLKK